MEETIIFNNVKFYKIKDFKQYYISKCGKVLSTKINEKGRYIALFPNNKGYYYCDLYQRNRSRMFIHRLVSERFIPNPDNKPCVNHIDGNPQNNNVENLEWCTYGENIKHSYDYLGRKKYGEQHNRSKLKDSDVIQIKIRLKNGEYCSSISKDYPEVSVWSIHNIKQGKNWRHLSQ